MATSWPRLNDTVDHVRHASNDRLKDDNEYQKTDVTLVLVSYAGNNRLEDDNEQPKSL
jgi:hypothetical protein